MFGKNLAHELGQYLRRMWPYTIALGIITAYASLIIIIDKNPVEMTGTMSAIGLFIITVLIYLIRGLVHAYKSFSKSLSSEKPKNQQQVNSFLWVRITAFMIFIVITALLILACVSAFAWKSVAHIFLSLNTDWPYFLEFLLYFTIVTATVYIIPIACIVASRFGKHQNISLTVGIITLLIFLITITEEILLLIHSPSTNMPLLWATVISLLAVFLIVDICMFLRTYSTLKTEILSKQNDDMEDF